MRRNSRPNATSPYYKYLAGVHPQSSLDQKSGLDVNWATTLEEICFGATELLPAVHRKQVAPAVSNPLPGDVYLAEFPFTDGSGGKARPVVLLRTSGSDLFVAPLTKNSARRPFKVELIAWAKCGLRSRGFVRCACCRLISQALVRDHLGRLDQEDWRRVLAGTTRWFATVT